MSDVRHRAAVLGSPVGHSLSPALHRAGYAAAGLTDWCYEPIECDGDALPGLVRSRSAEWAGFSVTMPGKSAAAAVADTRSARVQALGVANTLVRRDGGWHADNTDVDGLVGALRAAGAPPIRSALILGGGGTAAAVLAALAELGTSDVIIAGRRPASTTSAQAVADTLGLPLRVIGWDTGVVGAAAADSRPGRLHRAGRRGRSLRLGAQRRSGPFRRHLPPVADAAGRRRGARPDHRHRPGHAAAPAFRQFELITGSRHRCMRCATGCGPAPGRTCHCRSDRLNSPGRRPRIQECT